MLRHVLEAPSALHVALPGWAIARIASVVILACLVMSLPVAPAYAAAASWCEVVPLPTQTRPGTLVLRDGFEDATLIRWRVVDEGDAWARISSTYSRTGGCSGRLTVTSSWNSRANVQKALPAGTNDLWAVGWFRVDKQGSWGSNVPTFRFFNGSTRLLDVHRQNMTGDLFVRTRTSSGSWRYVKLNRTMNMYQWYKIEVYLRAAWSSSSISVWVNGTEVYRTSSAYLAASSMTTAMIGSEHQRQVMDLSFDDVVLSAP
jgi:hypothetical protein